MDTLSDAESILKVASLSGAFTVIYGALAAHALKKVLDEKSLATM